jgi:hypothetical protein
MLNRGGSRQSLSQTDQKPLKMKGPEDLHISSWGMPATFPAPYPHSTTLDKPDSILPQAKLETLGKM